MILIEHTVISDDVRDQLFVCNLSKCRGACCVEGDLGAPLEDEELPIIAEISDKVRPYLSDAGQRELDRQGPYILDSDGDYSTPTIDGKECIYAIYDENKILKCGIEQAYLDGKIDWKKPISCHLYPIRITKYDEFEALNYDRWHICAPACSLGRELGVPVYKFLKDALIRKYGDKWYNSLCKEIEERETEEDEDK